MSCILNLGEEKENGAEAIFDKIIEQKSICEDIMAKNFLELIRYQVQIQKAP